MGKFSRAKGCRVEREVVNYLKAQGYQAERVPLSGATTYAKGDVRVICGGEQRFIEVKAKAGGWPKLYRLFNGYGPGDTPLISGFVVFGTNFERVSGCFLPMPVSHSDAESISKVLDGLKALKKDCDYMAVKATGEATLFIKWFDKGEGEE